RQRVQNEVRKDSLLLLGNLLHRSALDQRRRQSGRRKRRGQGKISRGAEKSGDSRRAARTGQARRPWQPDREYLCSEGREERRRAVEYGDPHLPGGVSVLEVQAGGVPEAGRIEWDVAGEQVVFSVGYGDRRGDIIQSPLPLL